MTEQEFFERMDRDLEVTNQHMARGNEVMDGYREFIREMTRRNEVVTRELVREISAGREVLLDVHRESYAQREGIWQLIDELRRYGLGGRG
jgi:hypothetical protein